MKINWQELSREDQARLQNFCKIMAIGLARLQDDEIRAVAQAQADNSKTRTRRKDSWVAREKVS